MKTRPWINVALVMLLAGVVAQIEYGVGRAAPVTHNEVAASASGVANQPGGWVSEYAPYAAARRGSLLY